MMHGSATFIRYERRGARLAPVRVTKQWVNFGDKVKPDWRFIAVRATEVSLGRVWDRERTQEPWCSSSRVETRERLMTLAQVGEENGEPLVREAGYTEHWVPLGDLSCLTAAQAAWTLDNGNGWLEPRVWSRPGRPQALSATDEE